MAGNVRFKHWAIGVLAAATVSLASMQPIYSCGPFFDAPVFTYSLHPDLPLKRYAAGELGVIQPTYSSSFLWVAYRYLAGEPLTVEEQKAAVSLWHNRLGVGTEGTVAEAEAPWETVRKTVSGGGEAPSVYQYKALQDKEFYASYLNCTPDAFVNAAKTLTSRIAQFGKDHPAIKAWVEGQDQVFSNCSDSGTIPAEPSADWPVLLKQDRHYQRAAAYFYAGQFQQARQILEAIAQDKTSPWAPWAPYLIARSYIRQGTLVPRYGVEAQALGQAKARLQAILKEPAEQAFHEDAKRLLSYVENKLNPEASLAEMGRALSQPSNNTYQLLDDYTLLGLAQAETPESSDKKPAAAASNQSPQDSLTDWIQTVSEDPESAASSAFPHALSRWNKSRSVLWLVAALSKAAPNSDYLPQLLEAARAVPASSPASPTLVFHQARLLQATGRKTEARQLLNAALARPLPPSAKNLLLETRLPLAQSLQAYLTDAVQYPAAIIPGWSGQELPDDVDAAEAQPTFAPAKLPALNQQAEDVLNHRMPLSLLESAVASPAIPPRLKKELLLTVWVRALILNNEAVSMRLMPSVQKAFPKLTPLLAMYRQAKTPAEKHFVAAYLMLKNPGMSPLLPLVDMDHLDQRDQYNRNWWYLPSNDSVGDGETLSGIGSDRRLIYPEFLTPEQRTAGIREDKLLRDRGIAANFLAAPVIAWAKQTPGDPRVPEALHLAVRATRFSLTDDQTTQFSKQAYQLLHQKYPKSTWAKKTPYWY
jgi:hypothetical protein